MTELRQDRWWATCRERLAAVIAVDGPIDVPLAALWIAAEDRPGLDPVAERTRLAAFAREAAAGADGIDNPFARYEAVRVHLFENIGLRGNVDDYENPDNSYLDRVLDTYGEHRHAYDKVLVAAAGSITFHLPELRRDVTLVAGDRLDLPAQTLHGADVGPQGVTCLEAHLPAGSLGADPTKLEDWGR